MDSKLQVYMMSLLAVAICTVLMGSLMLPWDGGHPTCFLCKYHAPSDANVVVFNIEEFAAKADGYADDKKAFLSAWQAACTSTRPAKIIIPNGDYLLSSISFKGYCAQPITMQIDGELIAPTQNETICVRRNYKHWLEFKDIDGLTIEGNGILKGNGESWWYSNKCPERPVTLRFSRCRNSIVRGIKSVNSKKGHVSLDDCGSVLLEGLTMEAPFLSENTVGIHLEQSVDIKILNTRIATGDDCISIGPDSRDIYMEGIKCGPGHGISIGGLGRKADKGKTYFLGNGEFLNGGVRNVALKEATITETENGVRIKTFQGGVDNNNNNRNQHRISAINISFQNIRMKNVKNPIVIDQHYCPYSMRSSCDTQSSNGVEIREVLYKNIHGTSTTPIAVNFNCSQGVPCQGIVLEDVHLWNSIDGDEASSFSSRSLSSCVNAHVHSLGIVHPPVCV